MRRRLMLLAVRPGRGAGRLPADGVRADAKTFYWISHGSPADPVWTYFLAGAKQWAKDTGNTVNTSFHSGDVPSHQEAVRAAIAAKADGIVTQQPRSGQPGRGGQGGPGRAASRSSTSTRPTRPPSFDAYVGGDLRRRSASAGRSTWSTRGCVKSGRLRLDAGRGARRHLRRAGGGGHRLGVQAAGHHLGGDRHHARPGRDHHPHVGLPDRQPRARSRRSSASATWSPAASSACSTRSAWPSRRDPGRRLGQLARHDAGGAVGLRQRRACGRTRRRPAISACRWRRWRLSGIPPGFDVITGALYEKDTAQVYDDILSGK